MVEQLPGANSGHEPESERGAMAFSDHLDEFRSRLIKSLITLFVIFCVAAVYANEIILFLEGPLRQAMPNLPAGQKPLHFTGALDVIMANLKVAMLFALITGCPVWIYQLWRFVEPALFPNEKRYVQPFVVGSIFLFFLGIAFCFQYVLPLSLKFLIGMGTEIAVPIITVNDYISLLALMLLGFGAIFETPIVIFLLFLMGLFDASSLKSARGFALLGILIIAAVLTPGPDPVSQLTMAAPMYLMYEVSILIINVIEKKRGTQEQRLAKAVEARK
jgi:sec-independent protein translocase protein TatC